MAIEIKQRIGSSLLPVPLGCDCSGGGSGADAGELAAIRQELVTVAGAAQSASADAATALGLANDAAGAAQSAAEAAAAAGEKAAEALAAAGSVKGKILQNALVMHLGGSNASDTIVDGRGLTADLPFATINAAYKWAWDNAVFTNLIFELHGDIEQSVGFTNDRVPLVWLRRASDLTENPVVHLGGEFIIYMGCIVQSVDFELGQNSFIETRSSSGMGGIFFTYSNVTISNKGVTSNVMGSIYVYASTFTGLEGASYGVKADYGGRWAFDNLKLFGQFSDAGVILNNGSSLMAYNCGGEFTGVKYKVSYGSLLSVRGQASTLPGSIAGVCDATSKVI